MVFENDVVSEFFQEISEDGGVLLNDRREGDNVDDSSLAMSDGVFERKGERRERFAASGGNGERE